MIYLILPLGNNFGWGVCGKYITKELSFITDVKLITSSDPRNVGDELDYRFIIDKLIGKEEFKSIREGITKEIAFPILKAMNNTNFLSIEPQLQGSKNVGYTFFEDNIIAPELIENAKKNFDVIVTGSYWCEEILREYGLENVSAIIQGVDPVIFNTVNSEKEYFKDKFVIFSGGKLELRKGQDIVIRAFKVLHDRHDDVILVNSWFNQWLFSMETIKGSKYINFEINTNDYMQLISRNLVNNGIDISRVITSGSPSSSARSDRASSA